ncbi:MAG: flagellar M-ring protein FliF [Alphaproteobacteria bacterium]|nr:flagellar M-ring protein FliF [Alphaproteobacteria bacterium]
MNSFLETLRQLGPSRLGIMSAILVGLMMFFVFISMRISTPEMKLLYSDLSTADSSAIAAKLEENQIPYEISVDGSRIIAPEDEIGRARMLLAAEGLPNGGSMGYELFDKQSGFGTTNFVQNINQVRALEGELSRTISSLDSIRSARVHLVLPQRELFSRESRPSSASVFLGVRPGAIVERQQILGIQSLVASAVPELKISNVSIIDSNGNLLAKGEEESDNLLSVQAEEMRRNLEARLTEKIEDQVGRIVGFGNVRALVTAEMNFDRISTNEELFDPETQVVRSSQVTEESNTEREPNPQDISVENNLPGVGGDLLIDEPPSAESTRLEEVTNFEISRTVRNTVREAGEITKLSVGVLVDGRYSTNEEGDKVYEPRTQQELDQISSLVKSAIGYDDIRGDNIEVVNLQFAEIDTDEEFIDERLLFGFEKGQLLDVAEFLIVGIMIVLVALLVLQPMVNRLLEAEAPDVDETLEADLLAARPANPALAAPDGDVSFMGGDAGEEDSLINISGVDGKVKAASVKKVEEIVENYPMETISVIRSWMTQES